MDIPAPAVTAAKKFGEYLALFAVLGTVGTYWINTEVERRMVELAKDPGTHPVVVELKTTQSSLKEGQKRIETKVDTFSAKFLEYLERQAQ
jgi:hypothetical protein